jgi:hypothetical protein
MAAGIDAQDFDPSTTAKPTCVRATACRERMAGADGATSTPSKVSNSKDSSPASFAQISVDPSPFHTQAGRESCGSMSCAA